MNSVIEEKIDLLVKKQGEIQEEIVNLIGMLQNPIKKEMVEEKSISQGIDNFMNLITEQHQKYLDTYSKMDWKSNIVTTKGSKFLKVIDEGSSGGGSSVVAFINRNTGQIFKAASFKIPAKHARGNVLNEDNGLSALNGQGRIRYLK